MHLNTQKAIMWLSIAVAIETAIGAGTVSLTNAVPQAWIPTIVAWCGILAFIGSTMVAALTGNAIYGSPPKVAVLLLGGLLLYGLMPADAMAQTRIQATAQRNDINRQAVSPLVAAGSISEVVDKFYSITREDITQALGYAAAADDRAAVACYTEWQKQIDEMVKLREAFPDTKTPQLITAFQKARNLVRRLDTDSPLRQACAALAMDAKSDVQNLISKLVTGVAIKAFLPVLP